MRACTEARSSFLRAGDLVDTTLVLLPSLYSRSLCICVCLLYPVSFGLAPLGGDGSGMDVVCWVD